MKKEKYEKPTLEIINLLDVDIITASSPTEGGNIKPFGFSSPSPSKTPTTSSTPWSKESPSAISQIMDGIKEIAEDLVPTGKIDSNPADIGNVTGNVEENTPSNNNSESTSSDDKPVW